MKEKFRNSWKPKLGRLLQRAKRAPELSESVVRRHRLDDGVLSDMLERAPKFAENREEAPSVDLDDVQTDEGEKVELSDTQKEKLQEYVAWGDLYDDVFRALHTYHEPSTLPSSEIKPSRELNRQIINAITHDENFLKMRPHTRHSEIDAAFATMAMTDKLSEVFSEEMRSFILRIKEIEEAEQEMGGGGGGEGSPDESEEDRLERLARELAEKDEEQQQHPLQQAVREAIEESVQEGREAAEIMQLLPGREGGPASRIAPDEMINLATKWKDSDMLRRVSRMAGRLKRDMYQKRARRIRGGVEEMVDVKLGNDIPRLMPHELNLLNHPVAKRDFQRRYHEQSLLEWETEGIDSSGRGPLVVCIDGSGSMGGTKNVWARSVALALITIARKEKRDAAVVEFSAGGDVESWEFMRRERVEPEKIINFVSHFFGHGTEIYQGLQRSREIIDSRPEMKRSDIVLITDGIDILTDEDEALRQHFTARGVRIHGVSIEQEPEDNEYLQAMCDSVVGTTNLVEGSNEATDHLAQQIT